MLDLFFNFSIDYFVLFWFFISNIYFIGFIAIYIVFVLTYRLIKELYD